MRLRAGATLEPAEAGQIEVEDDEIDRLGAGERERLAAVCRLDHLSGAPLSRRFRPSRTMAWSSTSRIFMPLSPAV